MLNLNAAWKGVTCNTLTHQVDQNATGERERSSSAKCVWGCVGVAVTLNYPACFVSVTSLMTFSCDLFSHAQVLRKWLFQDETHTHTLWMPKLCRDADWREAEHSRWKTIILTRINIYTLKYTYLNIYTYIYIYFSISTKWYDGTANKLLLLKTAKQLNSKLIILYLSMFSPY